MPIDAHTYLESLVNRSIEKRKRTVTVIEVNEDVVVVRKTRVRKTGTTYIDQAVPVDRIQRGIDHLERVGRATAESSVFRPRVVFDLLAMLPGVVWISEGPTIVYRAGQEKKAPGTSPKTRAPEHRPGKARAGKRTKAPAAEAPAARRRGTAETPAADGAKGRAGAPTKSPKRDRARTDRTAKPERGATPKRDAAKARRQKDGKRAPAPAPRSPVSPPERTTPKVSRVRPVVHPSWTVSATALLRGSVTVLLDRARSLPGRTHRLLEAAAPSALALAALARSLLERIRRLLGQAATRAPALAAEARALLAPAGESLGRGTIAVSGRAATLAGGARRELGRMQRLLGARGAWPPALVASCAAVALTTWVWTSSPARPAVTTWFLIICPGMALVRLLPYRGFLTQTVLAVALSLAIETLGAEMALESHAWSPGTTLEELVGITLVAVALEVRIAGKAGSSPQPAVRRESSSA